MTIASQSILTGGEAGTVAEAVAAEVHRPAVELHRLAIVAAIAAASKAISTADPAHELRSIRALGIPCRPWLLCRHDEGVRLTHYVARFAVVRPGEIEHLALPASCLRDDGSTISRAGVSIIRRWQGLAPRMDIGWAIRQLLAELERRRTTARRLLAKIPKGATLAQALAAMPQEYREAAKKEVTR